MNILKINLFRPNKRLINSIFSSVDGRKLLKAGTVLTQSYLDTLRTRRKEEDIYELDPEEERAYDRSKEGWPGAAPRRFNFSRVKAGDTLQRGIYHFRDSVLWIIASKRSISQAELDQLLKLAQSPFGGVCLWYNDRFLIRDDLVVRGIVQQLPFVQKTVETYHIPEAKPDVKIKDISLKDDLIKHRRKRLPSEISLQEKREMITHYEASLEQLEETLSPQKLDDGSGLKKESIREHRRLVEETIEKVLNYGDLAANFLSQFKSREYLINHVFKVCILAIEVATDMGYNKQDIINIGLASILQDLGMSRLPDHILTQTRPLLPAEYKEIQDHPNYSVEILEETGEISKDAYNIVLQAHERLDGSGYPLGLRAEEIHDLSKIIGVVNVYAAMTSPRPYRPEQAGYEAMVTLIRSAHFEKLDRNVVKHLLRVLSLFPVGSLVRLNTGEIAKVESANEDAFKKPIISLQYDANGSPYHHPFQIIDLRDASDLEILEPAGVEGEFDLESIENLAENLEKY